MSAERSRLCLLALTIAVASCGGSGDVAVEASTTTAPAPASSTSATADAPPAGDHWAQIALLDRCPPAPSPAASGFDGFSTIHEAVIVIAPYAADDLDGRWLTRSSESRQWLDYPGPNDVPVPAAWLAASIEETELVVCIDYIDTEDAARVCEYSGGQEVIHLRRDVTIVAYDAASGEVVSTEVERGPTEVDCPTLETFKEGQKTKTRHLDPPAASLIKDKLAALIAP